MSGPSKLSNKRDDIMNYVISLAKQMPAVQKVWLTGSRSPRTTRDPRPESDWDICFQTDNGCKYRFPHPRNVLKILHLDLIAKTKEQIENYPGNHTLTEGVEIWPTDKYDIVHGSEDNQKKKTHQGRKP